MTVNIKKTFVFVALLLACGQSSAFEADTLKTDTVCHKADSVKAVTKPMKPDCCADSTVKDHQDPYHKVVKEGGSVREGLMTVRHVKDDWYLEVPDELLGRMLLCVTRFTSVPQDFKMLPGEEVNRSAVYFEQRSEKVLLLREYVQSSYAKPGDRIAISVKQSTVDPIVYRFDIIGRNPDTKARLVKMTPWLMADNKVTSFTASDRTQLGIGAIVADRSFVDTVKVFPINLEIQTMRTYAMTSGKSPASRAGSATLSLNTSVVLLPEEPMQPRYADERVGYFNNRITEFSDDQQVTNHEAIVMRYRLEPKDPAAYKAGRLVEPKKQIVYYIDPATPKKWVKYLKMGIDDWNVAFEAAGFKNAIQAREWPENDSTMSLDDARFSVLRYLPSETENAYGPRIVDPRSGEIMESHICWYHNVMNLLKKWYMVQCGPLDKRARKMEFSDELMGQLIRFVSSHEVGHTLGLRHNMIASQATPVEKLRDKAWVEQHGHTSSIMDYARFNYVAQPEDKIGEKGLFPRINDYDKWAIKWGYQYRPEFKDADTEKKALRSEVTKVLAADRRLWWCGDEGRGQDPRSQSEDLGDNQMRANDYGIKNLKRVMQNIEQWTAQPDGQYDHLNEMHRAVRTQYQRYVNHVQKYLFSKYVNNAPGQKNHDIVPRELQREAIDWIGRHVMEAPLWLYPASVVDKLGVDYLEEIRTRQQTVIAMLLSPNAVQHLLNDRLASSKAYPVEEYFDDVFAMVWKGQSDSFRRQQQRTYVDFLGMALNPSQEKNNGTAATASGNLLRSDVVLYFLQHLGKIEDYLKGRTSPDALEDMHYRDLLVRVKKIRERYESGK